MSYSFTLRAADKDAAKAAVSKQFKDVVIANQPSHRIDQQAAVNAIHSLIDLLPHKPERDVYVSVSGYLTGLWERSELVDLAAVNLKVDAAHVERLPNPQPV